MAADEMIASNFHRAVLAKSSSRRLRTSSTKTASSSATKRYNGFGVKRRAKRFLFHFLRDRFEHHAVRGPARFLGELRGPRLQFFR
jgi:hypothetical protein